MLVKEVLTKALLLVPVVLCSHQGTSQTTLDANGPGDTYELITSVLAPDQDPIETPDCSHAEFGNHIDEIFDEELNIDVFRFHIHTTPDNDRCKNFDRQRNEIKSYDKSPDNLLAVENETVIYKWKFKLSEGFQSSPNFTHLHQLKSVGGDLASMPMYTLTTRKGTPDQLELRYAETDKQVTLLKTDLNPFIGIWLEVTETIKYGESGTYEIEIRKVNNGSILFTYSNDSIINWRMAAEFVRPKWGIYRSLINAQDLRDETVLFANFSIKELETTSSKYTQANIELPTIITNPVINTVYLNNISKAINLIQVLSVDGQILLNYQNNNASKLNINVSSLSAGPYIISFKGNEINQSKMIVVLN